MHLADESSKDDVKNEDVIYDAVLDTVIKSDPGHYEEVGIPRLQEVHRSAHYEALGKQDEKSIYTKPNELVIHQ